MANSHIKRCSTSLIIREVQIKTIRRYHFRISLADKLQAHVRMAIIKKTTKIMCCQRCGEKGTLVHCWWDCKLVQPLWKTEWIFLKKLKIELSYDPAIPLWGIYPEKKHNSKRHMHPNVHCSTIYNSQVMEAT